MKNRRSIMRTLFLLLGIIVFALLSLYNTAGSLSRTQKSRRSSYQEIDPIPRTRNYRLGTEHHRYGAADPLAHEATTFPCWGAENNSTIRVQDIMDFVKLSSVYASHPRELRSKYIPTSDHPYASTVNYWFPEVVYAVTKQGILHTSNKHRRILHNEAGQTVRDKLMPTEEMMQQALRRLRQEEDGSKRWPRLLDILQQQGGFIFLAWYGDYTGCNQNNWRHPHNNHTLSIPLFTPSARLDCNYAFPFPNYQTILDSAAEMATTSTIHLDQVRKIVWRGGMTGAWKMNATYRTPRWRLVQQANTTLFDVAATRLPARHNISRHAAGWLDRAIADELGGRLGNSYYLTNYSKYRGVLDIDGNSWSSRFGGLLCGDAIVLKVQPTFVDYWYPSVEDGNHFLSVHANLSNLKEVAAYVVDPTNDDNVQEIIQNANHWCREHMRYERILDDMLDIWETYVTMVYNVRDWKEALDTVMNRSDFLGLEMVSAVKATQRTATPQL